MAGLQLLAGVSKLNCCFSPAPDTWPLTRSPGHTAPGTQPLALSPIMWPLSRGPCHVAPITRLLTHGPGHAAPITRPLCPHLSSRPVSGRGPCPGGARVRAGLNLQTRTQNPDPRASSGRTGKASSLLSVRAALGMLKKPRARRDVGPVHLLPQCRPGAAVGRGGTWGRDAALLLPRGESLRGHPTSQLRFRLQVRGRVLLGELP